jgi:phosphoglycolate phosphatase
MKYKLVVFDWDGTLVDSVAHIVECLRVASEKTRTPYPGDVASRRIIGLGMTEALQQLFGERDDEFTERFREAYSGHFFSRTPVAGDFFPGVLDTLQKLRRIGCPLAVATGKSSRGMDAALGALGMEDWFVGVKCADKTASKPDPLMLRQLLSEHVLLPHQAVMVGDTSFDMEMAERACVPAMAVSYGAHEIETLLKYKPLVVLHEFRDILKYVL